MKELTYYDKKAIHNLKYFTWVEQQGRDVAELRAQWHDHATYWDGTFALADRIDGLITDFNQRVGLHRLRPRKAQPAAWDPPRRRRRGVPPVRQDAQGLLGPS